MKAMIQIGVEKLEDLVQKLKSLAGSKILVSESISRSRDVGGHDRHFATRAQFEMLLDSVEVFFSGAQLALLGKYNFQYDISVESIVRIDTEEENTVRIVEWYESKTERETTIRAIA